MYHPEYRLITQEQSPLLESTLTPIYPLCSGITQAKMKQWVNKALEVLNTTVIDDYFEKIANNTMPSLKDSLFLLHHPKKGEDLSKIEAFKHISQQRLIIEELATHQLSLLRIKMARKAKKSNIFIKSIYSKYRITHFKKIKDSFFILKQIILGKLNEI